MSQYNTDKLKQRVNQVTAEEGGKGVAGLYRHPESGEEMITLSDPLFGEAQSNAAVQLGFVRVGDTPKGAVKSIEIATVAAAASETDSMKGLTARISAMEGVQARNQELEAEVEKLRAAAAEGAKTDHNAVVDSAATAKESAQAQQDARQEGTDGAGTTQPENPLEDVKTPEETPQTETDEERAAREAEEAAVAKPLSAQDEAELRATAEREGVSLEGLEGVENLREAVQKARAEKESENQ